MGSAAISKALESAHRSHCSMFHVHLHEHRGPAALQQDRCSSFEPAVARSAKFDRLPTLAMLAGGMACHAVASADSAVLLYGTTMLFSSIDQGYSTFQLQSLVAAIPL